MLRLEGSALDMSMRAMRLLGWLPVMKGLDDCRTFSKYAPAMPEEQQASRTLTSPIMLFVLFDDAPSFRPDSCTHPTNNSTDATAFRTSNGL